MSSAKGVRVFLGLVVLILALLALPAVQGAIADWLEPAVAASGNWPGPPVSELIEGNPAVTYALVTGGERRLAFRRAVDQSGDSWGDPVTVQGGATDLLPLALEEIDGRAAILFQDVAAGQLKYVRAVDVDGETWGEAVVVADDAVEAWLLNINGLPSVIFRHSAVDALSGKWVDNLFITKSETAVGSDWSTPQSVLRLTDHEYRKGAAAVVDGRAAIAFVAISGVNQCSLSFLLASDPSSENWSSPALLTNGVGCYAPTLALAEVDGRMAVVVDIEAGSSKYVDYLMATSGAGNSWNGPVHVDGPFSPFDQLTAVLREIDGKPVIALARESNPWETPYWTIAAGSTADGQAWSKSNPLPDVTASALMLLEVNNQIALTYNALRYANPRTWRTEYLRASELPSPGWATPYVLESTLKFESGSDLVDVGGQPAIGYNAAYPGPNLRYVRASDPIGSAWSTPVVVAPQKPAGRHLSLAVVNGNPAMIFTDQIENTLSFIRALDGQGANWGAEVPIDAGRFDHSGNTLMVVDEMPAVIYYDYDLGRVKYVRAKNTDGTSWNTPQVLDLNNVAPFSAAVINDLPALVYSGDSNWGIGPYLSFARAASAAGSSWSETLVTDDEIYAQNLSVHEIGGKPAIAFTYHSVGGPVLAYVVSSDSEGATWEKPVKIGSVSSYLSALNLREHGGKPVIMYVANGELRYVAAESEDGATWANPEVVAKGVGYGTDPEVLDDCPAASFLSRILAGPNVCARNLRAGDANANAYPLAHSHEYTNGHEYTLAGGI